MVDCVTKVYKKHEEELFVYMHANQMGCYGRISTQGGSVSGQESHWKLVSLVMGLACGQRGMASTAIEDESIASGR